MKKLILAAFVVLAMASSAFAAGQARLNTGCGLGTMLFQNNADGSWVLQSFQATTNGTFGNQTFGITSGTSECQQPRAAIANNEELKQFVIANMDSLAKDIAAGQGETLNSFNELLNIPADQRAEFNNDLQTSFSRIFPHQQVVYAEVMDNVAAVTNIR